MLEGLSIEAMGAGGVIVALVIAIVLWKLLKLAFKVALFVAIVVALIIGIGAYVSPTKATPTKGAPVGVSAPATAKSARQ